MDRRAAATRAGRLAVAGVEAGAALLVLFGVWLSWEVAAAANSAGGAGTVGLVALISWITGGLGLAVVGGGHSLVAGRRLLAGGGTGAVANRLPRLAVESGVALGLVALAWPGPLAGGFWLVGGTVTVAAVALLVHFAVGLASWVAGTLR